MRQFALYTVALILIKASAARPLQINIRMSSQLDIHKRQIFNYNIKEIIILSQLLHISICVQLIKN